LKFTHTHSIWHQYDVIDMLIKLVIVTQLQHLNTTNDCNKLNNNSITIEITIWCNINAMITSTKLTQNSLRHNWILQPSLVLAIKTRWEKHSTNYKCHSYIVIISSNNMTYDVLMNILLPVHRLHYMYEIYALTSHHWL
jgi:hypothetical protein